MSEVEVSLNEVVEVVVSLEGRGKVVLKHDAFAEVGKKFESIDEHRFLNSCLENTYQRKLLCENTHYTVDVHAYALKSNVSLGRAYQELVDIAKKYMDTVLEIKVDKSTTWRTTIIHDMTYDDNLYTIAIQWNKKIIPLISGEMIKGSFCYYDSRMDKVPSSKRYLMGELLQRNLWKLKKQAFFVLKVPEIRYHLNIQDDEYQEYKELNRTIIKATLKDLEKNLNIKLYAKGNRHQVRFSYKQEELA